MPRSTPPLAWFSAFECAARRLSFTAAAAELNLTQSAISQHIRSLERRLGCALFVRKHRGIALTDEGRRLLPTVARAVGSLREATQSFDVPDAKRVLTVSASISVVQTNIAPRLASFIERHPGWGIHLTTRVWPDEFLHSSADVEIPFGALDNVVSEGRSLGPDGLILVAAPGQIQSSQFAASFQEITALPLVQVLGTSDNWQAWSRRVGYDGPLNIVCSVESHGMAVQCARDGIGVAYTSALIAAPALLAGQLVRLGETRHSPLDGYTVRVLDNENKPMATNFVSWLDGEIAQTIGKLEVL